MNCSYLKWSPTTSETDEKISLDANLLKGKWLTRNLFFPNPKARKYYKLEDNPTPLVFQLPLPVGILIKGHQLSSIARINVWVVTYEMVKFEATPKSLVELTSWLDWWMVTIWGYPTPPSQKTLTRSAAFSWLGAKPCSIWPTALCWGLTASSRDMMLLHPSSLRNSAWRTTRRWGTVMFINSLELFPNDTFHMAQERTRQSLEDAALHRACSSTRSRMLVSKLKMGRTVSPVPRGRDPPRHWCSLKDQGNLLHHIRTTADPLRRVGVVSFEVMTPLTYCICRWEVFSSGIGRHGRRECTALATTYPFIIFCP